MSEYCAAIDFGTNTARLLIADRTATGIVPVCVERVVVRLGGGFTDDSGLSVDAMERGLACLKKFSTILAGFNVSQVTASATSAVRDAINGAAFVEKILQETGIKLVVIDGYTEASLTLKGVLSALDTQNKSLVVLDVGGGSTEFTVATHGTPVFIRSMPIGVVRLTEGFRSSPELFERVKSVIDQLEDDVAASNLIIPDNTEFVGTAGTATTIAAILLEMEDYDYRLVNNYTVGRDDIREIYNRLSHMEPTDRLAIKGLEKGREDLIIAGLIIIISIMDRFDFKWLKVSDFGLLEGLALSEYSLTEDAT